jgi:hypothetical protein
VIKEKFQNLLIIFGCGAGELLKADSQLSQIFEVVVREQVEADRGVLSPIDVKKLKLNCNETLDIRDSTTSYLLWKTKEVNTNFN